MALLAFFMAPELTGPSGCAGVACVVLRDLRCVEDGVFILSDLVEWYRNQFVCRRKIK